MRTESGLDLSSLFFMLKKGAGLRSEPFCYVRHIIGGHKKKRRRERGRVLFSKLSKAVLNKRGGISEKDLHTLPPALSAKR